MGDFQKNTQLILGSAFWGWTLTHDQVFKLLDLYYEAGFRKVDAATNYPINKNPMDFRRSERLLQDWIIANQVKDLEVIMKVGSLNNRRTPDHNLSKSFLLMNLDDYLHRLGDNLKVFSLHWDNRNSPESITQTLEALQVAKEMGLRIGLSGIRYPELYAALNRVFQFDFLIQIKHNLLTSDYERYHTFHGKSRFIAYGINAGGVKFEISTYHDSSALKTRGRPIELGRSIAKAVKQLIQSWKLENEITQFNQCAMINAYHHPEIEGIIIGPSSLDQLKNTLEFYDRLKTGQYQVFYEALVRVAQENKAA